MPSKEEVSAFFHSFSRKVAGTRGRATPPPRMATVHSSSSASGRTTASQLDATLLTQVAQSSDKSKPPLSRDKVGTASSPSSSTSRRLQEIRNMPKNLSPVDPSRHPALLPRALPSLSNRKCLVLDVDETLVHSSYQPVHKYDLHLPLRVNGATCNVYVAFRPFLKEFLRTVQHMFEVVIFTASVRIYCDPLMDVLDPERKLGSTRLFREHCTVVNGTFVKDLSLLGRPLEKTVIVDNSPVAYLFQPRNAIPIISWFDDPDDVELTKLIPLLERLSQAQDIYEVLDMYNSELQSD